MFQRFFSCFETMAVRAAMISVWSIGVNAIQTPFGDRLPQCVVEIPDGAVVSAGDFDNSTFGLTHASGHIETVKVPPECLVEAAELMTQRTKRRATGPKVGVGQWEDNMGYTYYSGYGHFSGSYNIPATPRESGQILYYFIGLENTESGSDLNILQPVLAYEYGGWTLASWACCPRGATFHSTTLYGLEPGTVINGKIDRVDSRTWNIVSEYVDRSGTPQQTTLSANWLPYRYVWADVTLEQDYIRSCDQYSDGKVTFSQLNLQDENEAHVYPQWNGPRYTECGGVTTVVNAETITIQHNTRVQPEVVV